MKAMLAPSMMLLLFSASLHLKLASGGRRTVPALTYGPGGCVSLSASAQGSCVIRTNCGSQDLSKVEFAFNCELPKDDGVVRHSFGFGGFDSAEEFDTDVKCAVCSRPTEPEIVAPKVEPASVALKVAPVKHMHFVASHSATETAAQVLRLRKPHHTAAGGAQGTAGEHATAGQHATGATHAGGAHTTAAPALTTTGEQAGGKHAVPAVAAHEEHGEAKHASSSVHEGTAAGSTGAIHYGPKNCVSTFKKDEHCILKTDCNGIDLSHYEFGLICVDKAGTPVRHLFGRDSFEFQETFDTLIECEKCQGLEDVPGGAALSGELQELSKTVKALTSEMVNLTANIGKLNVKVFGDESATSATASGPAAAAPPSAPAAAPPPAQATALVHKRVAVHHGADVHSKRARHQQVVTKVEAYTADEHDDDSVQETAEEQRAARVRAHQLQRLNRQMARVKKDKLQMQKTDEQNRQNSEASDDSTDESAGGNVETEAEEDVLPDGHGTEWEDDDTKDKAPEEGSEDDEDHDVGDGWSD